MEAIFDMGPAEPCPAPFNLAEHVLGHGHAPEDKIALAVVGPSRAERWSYARLMAAVRGVGTGLLEQGFVPGDIVLMRIGNQPEFPIAYLGAIAAGLVPVPTSPQLTESEVVAMIADLAPAAILHAPDVPCADAACSVIETQTMRGWYALPPVDWHRGDPNRLAYIVYTSGTSGTPRAVAHAHRAIWARRMMVTGWYGLGPDDRLLHAGAFNWTFTLGTGLLDPWSVGATALIPAAGVEHAQIPLLLRRHEASLFAAAPGVYRSILKHHDKLDLPRLRHGLAAGEKLAGPIREAWRQATGTEVYEAFGMSECSTFISSAPDSPADRDALGRPQPGRRVAILGENRPVGIGEEGEIAIDRSDPGLMLGYLGAEQETAARFRGDWFVTGDKGRMDAEFQVFYLGRADDMMNAGGYRVSPIEVEAALLAHPGIDEAGVTDVDIKPGVSIIAAFWAGPEALSDTDLAAWCETRLARYKQPRHFQRLEALPKNANGKLVRKELKAQISL
ncbi:class I adenylate-forming enzyme family protein [Roseivivax sp. THAF30]|uniref:class I adenylate-forming enzyme family protein n=1 Tax=Roseivivax sp. THAF30 TaxID=2587852 RepID=UPI0012691D42|nr:class I adenylate-forming enzyme family protein [Roseivivax sp. THAF30]QFT63257.1 Long-chain-fatty-acid--CoA ligase [Roseivivax sp. THAF30]